jgi:anti-sigma B factor antagonist
VGSDTTDEPDYGATVDRSGEPTRVAVRGEVDIATAPHFAATVRDELAEGPVVLDVAGLTFMDSAGINAINAIMRDGAEVGWDLRIEGPLQPAIEQVLRMTGMLDVLPLRHDPSPGAPA